jgi:hypothetical protein
MTEQEAITQKRVRRARHERLKRRTAAFEAAKWCRKLYPWRISSLAVQRIRNAAPGIRIATGLFEAMLNH